MHRLLSVYLHVSCHSIHQYPTPNSKSTNQFIALFHMIPEVLAQTSLSTQQTQQQSQFIFHASYTSFSLNSNFIVSPNAGERFLRPAPQADGLSAKPPVYSRRKGEVAVCTTKMQMPKMLKLLETSYGRRDCRIFAACWLDLRCLSYRGLRRSKKHEPSGVFRPISPASVTVVTCVRARRSRSTA